MEDLTLMFIAGIVILTMSLLLHLRKRHRLDAEKKAKRRAAAQAAREQERQRQLQAGEQVRFKSAGMSSDRLPLSDPVGKTFTGAASPQSIAKWEVEIHQIGRQIMGRIDSKMVALQTLTLEADRSANRLELLIEHLERLVEESKKSQVVTLKDDTKSENSIIQRKDEAKTSFEETAEEIPEETPEETPEEIFEETIVERSQALSEKTPPASPTQEFEPANQDDEQYFERRNGQDANETPEIDEKKTLSNLISAGQVAAPMENFADLLDDLESEIDELHDRIETSSQTSTEPPVLAATVLKPNHTEDRNLPPKEIQPGLAFHLDDPREVSREDFRPGSTFASIPEPLIAAKPSPSLQIEPNRHSANPFALSSPRLPGELTFPSNVSLQLDTPATPTKEKRNPYMESVSGQPLTAPAAGKRITVQADRMKSSGVSRPINGLSIGTLYESGLETETTGAESSTAKPGSLAKPPVFGSRLALRKQVEMLADSGYTANQIAQNLNITVGEVDLMLSLRN